MQSCTTYLYIVFHYALTTISRVAASNRVPVTLVGVTKVLETVRKYLNGRATH
jgi:hypothetical protein